MTPEKFITDLKSNVYCRLQTSPIHNVGVFAIRPILAGTTLFEGCRPATWTLIPVSVLEENQEIPEDVKTLARDLYGVEDGMMHVPDHGLNDVNISYFVNHSPEPNTCVDEEGEEELKFIAMRDIAPGEEILVDYKTYIHEKAR
ncbi:MAG: SET domain-containing protein [Candidatus Sungbacteria bacterium]|nr:SET domain-containing protein [Candidatus Sungbacteria bacterium]